MRKFLVTGIVASLVINLWAQAPEMFRYQGRLVDGTNLVNATLPMSFKLYDTLSGGNKLYEDSSSVLVVDGLYSTTIGDNTVFGSLTNAMTNAAVYLELTVSGATLSPRERLVSVPYALNAGGNTTPAGTIVLSDTYPNPELESQGYSLVYDNLETDDWREIDGAYLPDLGWDPDWIAHSNQLWIMSDNNNLFMTVDGKNWKGARIPLEDAVEPEFLSHNGSVYFFQTSASERGSCSTPDGQSWSTWSNNIDPSIELWAFASFKDALWAFAQTNTGMGRISIVMQSTNGVDWIQTSTGTWDAYSLDTSDDILISADKIWLIAQPQDSPEQKVWHSTNGINWTQSATNLPVDRMNTENVFFNNKLWCFSPEEQSCWNSSDDGDSWSLITTNLPVSSSTMNFELIVHENKLWMAGDRSSSSRWSSDVSWSTNGIDWNLSLSSDATPDLIGTEDGRLWAYVDTASGRYLCVIGGPKKQDRLYYYRKD
jgi:hypothetical protein